MDKLKTVGGLRQALKNKVKIVALIPLTSCHQSVLKISKSQLKISLTGLDDDALLDSDFSVDGTGDIIISSR